METLICAGLEAALVGIVGPAVAGLASVSAGRSPSTKALPCVICWAEGEELEEDPKGSGNFWVNWGIAVKGSAGQQPGAASPTLADIALATAAFNAVHVDNLVDLVNGAGTGITVFPNGFFFSAPKSGRDEEGVWSDELRGRVYCCGGVIPE
jgi:hypothetical protein